METTSVSKVKPTSSRRKMRVLRPKSARSAHGYGDASGYATSAGSETASLVAFPNQRARRRSILEHIDSAFSKTGIKTFIYRLVIIGTHEENPEELLNLTERFLIRINSACYDEPGSGICLFFPNHIFHVLEGSEDTINKFLSECAVEFEDKIGKPDQGNEKIYKVQLKILNFIRVSERYTDRWHGLVHQEGGTRNVLRAHGFRNRLYETIKSGWLLAAVFGIFTELDDPLNPIPKAQEFSNSNEALVHAQAEDEYIKDVDHELNAYIPTTEAISYFFKPKKRMPPLRTPKEYTISTTDIPNIIFDSETVWPISTRIAPYD